MNCNFDSKDNFIKCVYDYFCQCKDQCLKDYEGNFQSRLDTTKIICSEITSTSVNPEKYDDLINAVINYFEKTLKLLVKRGNVYYIQYDILSSNGIRQTKKLKLTWDNIKSIEKNEKPNNQELFWFFRKLIVDSIIKKILNENKFKDLKVYSVGSAKLDSDYDITLYGNTADKIKMITEFEKYFKSILLDDSSVVFDTNVYGKAFITYDENEYESINVKNIYANVKDEAKYCGQQFYYLKSGDSSSQLMWGLIKYLKDLREGFGENLYNQVRSYMESKIGEQITYAHSTFIYLKNQPKEINYNLILSSEEKFKKDYLVDKLQKIHDYLGLLNFYGNETYFTRGAFLDVVINYQTCKMKEPLKLLEIDYITSILENAGFFFVHNNKTKYILRVYRALKKLDESTYKDVFGGKSYNNFVKIINDLKTIKKTEIKDSTGKVIETKEEEDYDEKYCNNLVLDDNFELLKCEKYKLFGLLMTIVCKVIETYVKRYEIYTDKPYFYKYYITKENILEGQIATSPGVDDTLSTSPRGDDTPNTLLQSQSLFNLTLPLPSNSTSI